MLFRCLGNSKASGADEDTVNGDDAAMSEEMV